ncbi:hypothetical protein EXS57_00960 [Candidatus Kaiserbacteria bacterium]|nr:hypothetical protein [Candidatus Kaiserbacteria bacterium]
MTKNARMGAHMVNNNENVPLEPISGEAIRLLGVMMQKAVAFSNQIDTQANVFIGLNLAVLGFLISYVTKYGSAVTLAELVPQAFAILSLTSATLAIHPPAFLRNRKNDKQSLFYNRTINRLDQASYLTAIENVAADDKKLLEQVSLEIYNMYKYYYSPKRRFLNYAKNLFLVSVLLQFVIIAFAFF